jgi:peptide/nickel transport system permease protein
MKEYVTRRILVSILVIVGLSLLTFSMIHMVPGDPVRLMYGRHFVSPVILENVRHQFGLDLPLLAIYLTRDSG